MAKVPNIPLNHLKQLFTMHHALITKAGRPPRVAMLPFPLRAARRGPRPPSPTLLAQAGPRARAR